MNKTNVGATTNTVQILLDVFTVSVAFAISVLVGMDVLSEGEVLEFFVLAAIFCMIYIISNKEENVYNITIFYYIDRIYKKITKSFLIAAVAVSAMVFYTSRTPLSRRVFLTFLVLSYIFLFADILLFRCFLNKWSSEKATRVIMVGKRGNFNKFNYFIRKTNIKLNEIGYVVFDQADYNSSEYLGTVSDLEEIIKDHAIDQVYILQKRDMDMERVQDSIDICINMGVTVRVVVDCYKRRRANSYVSSIGTYPIITYHTVSLNNYEKVIKRAMDVAGSLFGIILTSPIMLVTAIAVLIDSRGPVIFRQVRVGQNGREFVIYKFRSMCNNAESEKKELLQENEIQGDVMFKIKDDPRVTRVGKIIRKLSIDELPQFFNVLKGDMSLVGTRPPTKDEVKKYNLNQWRRISIKPGITGMWQVNGRSNVHSFDEIVGLDTEYIDNWSLFLDIKIILKTIVVLLNREGAC